MFKAGKDSNRKGKRYLVSSKDKFINKPISRGVEKVENEFSLSPPLFVHDADVYRFSAMKIFKANAITFIAKYMYRSNHVVLKNIRKGGRRGA